MNALRKIVPSSLKEAVFLLLTFANVGITTFFVKTGHFPEAIFSGVTSLLCFGVWTTITHNK